MVIKFKNKKTCKRLNNLQKGGSKSSSPPPKISKNVKKTIEKVNKIFKKVGKHHILKYYIESPTKGNLQEFKARTPSFSHIAHLVSKNYGVVTAAFKENRLKKKLQKYSSKNNPNSSTFSIIKDYVKNPQNYTNQIQKINLQEALLKTMSKKITTDKDKIMFKEQINKMLHPI